MAQESIGTAALNIVVDTTQFDQAITAAKRSMSSMSTTAQSEYQKLGAADRRRVDSLRRQADTLGFTRQQQILYNAALRGVPLPILDELKTKLAQTGEAAAKSAKQFNQYGISAAQEAAALRGVPAQITDIFVGLQGGQNPLTVLLQQGGQLKDMFGGVVPAARALGGALLGLINPYTLAAAAAGTLALAAYRGGQEAEKFRESLILTGGAAGKTADDLVGLSKSLGQTLGSQSRAADVLNQVIATGRVTSGVISEVTLASARWSQATGQDVADVVAEFAKIAEDPVQAVLDLNDKYGILTTSVYQLADALVRQGREQEAAELVAREASRELDERAARHTENLGTLQRAWRGVATAAKLAWDFMLDIGREDTLGEKIATAQRELRAIQDNQRIAVERGSKLSEGEAKTLRTAAARVAALEAERDAGRQAATAEAERVRVQREGIAALAELNDRVDQGASKTEKLRKAREQNQRLIERIRQGGQEVTEKQIKALDDATKRQYEDKGGNTVAAGARMLAQAREQEAVLRAQLDSSVKIGTARSQLLRFEQQITDLKAGKQLTADQKSILSQEKALRAQLTRNAGLEAEAEALKQIVRVETARQANQAALANDMMRYADALEVFGGSSRMREQVAAQQQILRDYQRLLQQATRDLARDQITQETFDSLRSGLETSLAERLKAQRGYYEQLDALEKDWRVGARGGLEEYAFQAGNVAEGMRSAFQSAFQGAEEALTRFVIGGKLSFRDLANSILEDLARISIRQSITGPLAGALGSALSGMLGSAGSVSGAQLNGIGGTAGGLLDGITFSTGGYTGDLPTGSVAGLVHGQEYVLNAEATRRIGRENLDAINFGGLQRLSAGLGGYAPPASSAGAGNGVQVSVYIDGEGQQTSTSSPRYEQFAQDVGRYIDQRFQQLEARSQRQGGMGWMQRNGRA